MAAIACHCSPFVVVVEGVWGRSHQHICRPQAVWKHDQRQNSSKTREACSFTMPWHHGYAYACAPSVMVDPVMLVNNPTVAPPLQRGVSESRYKLPRGCPNHANATAITSYLPEPIPTVLSPFPCSPSVPYATCRGRRRPRWSSSGRTPRDRWPGGRLE